MLIDAVFLTVKTLYNKWLGIVLLLMAPCVCLGSEATLSRVDSHCDSISFEITYRQGVSSLEIAMAGNAEALERIGTALETIPRAEIDKIIIASGASPEGSVQGNARLSAARASDIREYLSRTFDLPDSLFFIHDEGVRWEVLRDSVVSRGYDFARDIVRIVDEMPEVVKSPDGQWLDSRLHQLKNLQRGQAYDELIRDVFPSLRSTRIILVRSVVSPEHDLNLTPEPEKAPEPEPHSEPDFEPEPSPLLNTVPSPNTDRFAFASLKNNLLYDIALVANLGIEAGYGHFSFNLPVTYSPYDLFTNYKMRTLSFQPEIRYYFSAGAQGHFVGAEGHLAYFNVITPLESTTRFQDRDGEHPLYGGGLTYGYSLPFGQDGRWGIEFTVGAGYAFLDYDRYYNVDNGAWFTNGVRHYWGVTSAGINIFYRFYQNKSKSSR